MHQLKQFVLNDKDFLELAKKYTFKYREFSPVVDYCKVKWNKRKRTWELKEYFRHNKQKAVLPKKKNYFFLNLSITGFSWGDLFSEMERRFSTHLSAQMEEEEIELLMEENYLGYIKMREEYFREKKESIVKDWFVLTEENLEDYFAKINVKLTERLKDFSY